MKPAPKKASAAAMPAAADEQRVVQAIPAIEKTKPMWPQIRARLDRASARRDALATEAAGLALDVELGDGAAIERQHVVAGDLEKVEGEVARLRAALVEAEVRDSTVENAAAIGAMKAGLVELEGVCAARAKAAADMDEAIAAAVGAWLRLRASTELIRMSIPPGCSLPRGFVDLDLKRLVGGAMWKHSNVANPGEEAHAFPGASAPNFSTQYNATAIENVADAVAAQNAFVSGSIKRQIGETERFYAGELGEAV
jgi:hypothetical protein